MEGARAFPAQSHSLRPQRCGPAPSSPARGVSTQPSPAIFSSGSRTNPGPITSPREPGQNGGWAPEAGEVAAWQPLPSLAPNSPSHQHTSWQPRWLAHGPHGQGLQSSGGVGPGPGWATAHFLQPRPSTSKAAGGPVVTPGSHAAQPEGRAGCRNPGSRVLPRQLQSAGWAALRLYPWDRGCVGGDRKGE